MSASGPFAPFRRTARATLLSVVVLCSEGAVAQVQDSLGRVGRSWYRDELTLLAGYVQGYRAAGEFGIGRSIYGVVHHPFGATYYAGCELGAGEPLLFGPKVGVFVTGGVALGVQAIWYTDGTQSIPVFRPEMGIGLFKLKATYGYNVRFGNEAAIVPNTHVFSLSYAFRLRKRHIDGASL